MKAVELSVAERGEGPPLVLLHPVGLDNRFWGRLVEVASRDFRVLAMDLRGHGTSPAASHGLSMADYAGDVHVTMQKHGASVAIVLGLSFGGMIAQQMAVDCPDAVSALVMCACPGRIPEAGRESLRERGLAAERHGMASIVEPTMERWFNPEFRNTPAADRVRERLTTGDPLGFSAAWHAISGFDCLARLTRFKGPGIAIAGDRDAATPLDASREIQAAITGSDRVVLKGAPHMMQIEFAEEFTGVVTEFLQRLR